MKICQIVPWFPSRDPQTSEARQGVFEYRQARNLVNQGHEIRIITVRWNGQDDRESIDGIEVYRVPSIFTFRKIRYPIPDYFRLAGTIQHVSREWQPDIIVYAHVIYLTALPCLFLTNRVRKPVIVTTDVFPGINWFFGDRIVDIAGYVYTMSFGRLLLGAADGIQLLSSSLLEPAQKLKIDTRKSFVITRGVDTRTFSPGNGNAEIKRSLGFRDGDYIISCVGRLDTVKGVDFLLKAAKVVAARHNNVRFLIVGDGNKRNEYEQFVKPFKDQVIFTGFRSDVPELLRLSDAFVLPSISEGAANAVMEASSTGLPIVSTDVGEVPNIIIDNRTGILIKYGDVSAMVAAIERLIDDPATARRMGEEGRRRMETEYDWQMICKKLEDCYTDTIDRYESKRR